MFQYKEIYPKLKLNNLAGHVVLDNIVLTSYLIYTDHFLTLKRSRKRRIYAVTNPAQWFSSD